MIRLVDNNALMYIMLINMIITANNDKHLLMGMPIAITNAMINTYGLGRASIQEPLPTAK